MTRRRDEEDERMEDGQPDKTRLVGEEEDKGKETDANMRNHDTEQTREEPRQGREELEEYTAVDLFLSDTEECEGGRQSGNEPDKHNTEESKQSGGKAGLDHRCGRKRIHDRITHEVSPGGLLLPSDRSRK